MNCLNRFLLTVAVISVLLVLVPRVAADDELGILSVAREVAILIPSGEAEDQFANSTAVVSYGGCGSEQGGCSVPEGRGLQAATETFVDGCSSCLSCGNLWASVDFFGDTIRRCISKVAEQYWTTELGGEVHRDCNPLSPPKRRIFTPIAAAPVPLTCETCLAEPDTPNRWCVDHVNKAYSCYPKKLAEKVFCLNVKRYHGCSGAVLTKLPARKQQKSAKWLPVEINTCEFCVCQDCYKGKKFRWCDTQLSSTSTRFCTEFDCPGENALVTDTCTGMHKGATKLLINFAKNCAECLSPELKTDFIWCSKTFSGRKINYCVPKVAVDQLCHEGNQVTDCLMITEPDTIATVPVHKGGAQPRAYSGSTTPADKSAGGAARLALGVVAASVAAHLMSQ